MLKERVVTALIAVALLLALLFYAPPAVTEVAIGLVIAAAAWEWSQFLGADRLAVRLLFVAIVAAAEAVASTVADPGLALAVLYAALAWWAVATFWTTRFPTPIPEAIVWVAGFLVLLPTFVALSALYRLSPWWLLGLLVVVWLADIGAYFSGRRFGRRKLAPKISPGKTWEGVLGGLLAAMAVILAMSLALDLNPLTALLLGAVVVLVSVVGDLTVSMFKRTAGVKDSGRLFPGHGGVLDRVDSVCAAAPIFALGTAAAGIA